MLALAETLVLGVPLRFGLAVLLVLVPVLVPVAVVAVALGLVLVLAVAVTPGALVRVTVGASVAMGAVVAMTVGALATGGDEETEPRKKSPWAAATTAITGTTPISGNSQRKRHLARAGPARADRTAWVRRVCGGVYAPGTAGPSSFAEDVPYPAYPTLAPLR